MTTTHKVDLENVNPPPYWQKDMFLAYVLWFFLGWAGAHNFYTERHGIAVAQLLVAIIFILPAVVAAFLVGTVFIIPIFMPVTTVWLIVDLFLIPGRVRQPPYARYSRPVQNVHITIQNPGDSDK